MDRSQKNLRRDSDKRVNPEKPPSTKEDSSSGQNAQPERENPHWEWRPHPHG